MTTPDETGAARTGVDPRAGQGGLPEQGAPAGGYDQAGTAPTAATPSPTPRATPTPAPMPTPTPPPTPPQTTAPQTTQTTPPRASTTNWATGAAAATAEAAAPWHDRVRWGAVWAGALVALATFIVLQLLFFALGLLGMGYGGGTTTGGIVAGILALVAFFVGGLLAGASTMWRRVGDGLLHGVLVWALSLLVIVTLAVVGSGALVGPLADLFGAGQQQNIGFDPVLVLNSARQMAGWAALGLGVSVAAAALGGALGSKIWPGRGDPADLR
ncbi:hypothetical protein ACQPWY_03265 [Pseudonocardia xinjiangensis]|uniref:hypothetical protein n=1 Tax=Pseudonocardia xinjiangensis TaxID=75289 RepID=UPI003D8F031F